MRITLHFCIVPIQPLGCNIAINVWYCIHSSFYCVGNFGQYDCGSSV